MTEANQSFLTIFRARIRGVDSPHRLALGIAFGLMIGLIPKDSLLPYAFVVLFLLTAANLLCGIVAGVAISFAETYLDPLTHAIGMWALNLEPLQSTWQWLYTLPVVGWTRFENSVVMGSLLVGLMLFLPVYWLSLKFFKSHHETLQRHLVNNPLANWLLDRSPQQRQES